MARLPRYDRPDTWFHVMNRGIARRTVFETEHDIRYFLSRVAYAVRRGEIEVHCFCIMTTHYHLFVRSPAGRLSEAMRRIQNEYVRYFNRTRRRDGPLFRGRFMSRPVLSSRYSIILVRYIDANPVQARMAKTPWAYPHGSAARFMSRRPPNWLCGRWILGRVALPRESYPQANYASVWGRAVSQSERDLVEARIKGRGLDEDDLDDLVRSAPARVQTWMVRKARLADGTKPGLTYVAPTVIESCLNELMGGGSGRNRWRHRTPKGQLRDAWPVAMVGILRHLGGQTIREIAERLGLSVPAVSRRSQLHTRLAEDHGYAARLGRVSAQCLRSAFPRDGAGPRSDWRMRGRKR